MIARLAGIPILALCAVPASAQEDCEDWNTHDFFHAATAESVTACLEAGADLNARHEVDWDSPDGGNTPLHFAARYSWDPAVFVVLIEAGADVEARNGHGQTPLHLAAQGNKPVVVSQLVEAGADLDARDRNGNTPLHASARGGYPPVAHLLLELGADPTLVNDEGQIADPMSCDHWNTGVFARIATAEATAACLEAGADVNAGDEHGNTPLLLATSNRGGGTEGAPASEDPAIVTVLLEADADVNARDSQGNTPLLHIAGGTFVEPRRARYDRVENPAVMAALLVAGADVNALSATGATPLHQAASVEGVETVPMLLAAGSDIHARDSESDTPLLKAAYGGFRNPAVLEPLVAAGADVNDRNQRGATVLEHTLRSPSDRLAEVVRRLLDLGADVNEPGLIAPPLYHAASQGDNPELIAVLLAAGADVNASSRGGQSPLHGAARSGGPGVIAALVAAGADVDTRDGSGATPLHRAVEAKVPANVAALLEAGADVRSRVHEGDTPLHLSAQWPRRWTIRLDDPPADPADTLMVNALAAAGADIDARNDRGETPLHVATRNGHQPVVDKLLALGADAAAVDDLGRPPRPTVCDWTQRQFFQFAPWQSVLGCLQAGADVHARGESGETPLHRLASDAQGDPERGIGAPPGPYSYPFARVIAAFVKAGADVNAVDRARGTPLHEVAGRWGSGGTALAAALLDAGAEVNARDSRGGTPLHRVAGAGFPVIPGNDSLVSMLVEAGADLHATDNAGQTALHHALRTDDAAVAARLIELGADTGARDGSGHAANPVDCARFNTATFFRFAPLGTVAGCIEGGADVNAGSDWMGGSLVDGSTPLHFASGWAWDPAIVSLLLQAGAEVNARNNFRRSPLHEAAGRNADPAMIAALVEAGAELEVWTMSHHGEDGLSPLHEAVEAGHPSVVAALLEAGADVYGRHSEDGPTPLHRARNPEVVALLLEAGADIDARAHFRWPYDFPGMTPLHAAARWGHAAVFLALLDAGADPDALDGEGKSPMDYARENEVLQKLELVKRSGR
ncbi:MAG: ankyrin repeat domain-containing protein [Gemmatimonadota bacterium]|nr:ankyrin repeat domain-containing protein [Gemmatimonadota bacterium]